MIACCSLCGAMQPYLSSRAVKRSKLLPRWERKPQCLTMFRRMMLMNVVLAISVQSSAFGFGYIHDLGIQRNARTCFRSCHRRSAQRSSLNMIASSSRHESKRPRSTTTEKLAALSSTPFPSATKHRSKSTVSRGHNSTWSNDFDDLDYRQNMQSVAKKSPFPIMPSQLFNNLAQSQFELLSHSLVHNGDAESSNNKPGSPKTSSLTLYLPKENQRTGQLEFAVSVAYPNPSSERVFIASDSSESQQLQIIPPMLRLPALINAKELIPSYPFISASESKDVMPGEDDVMFTTSQDSSIGVSVVEEISSDAKNGSQLTSLSVTLFSGLDTLGVLMIQPFKSEDNNQNQWSWTENDKLQVTRAAKSLAMALSMDKQLTSTQVQSEQFRMAFADGLHQVKSPLQALRTFGKLLQRRLAEDSAKGPSMRTASNDSDDYEISWNRRQRQTLRLADDLVKQGERVVELIQPIDALINQQYLLPVPASTSEALVLYRQPPNAPEILPLGEFEMEMAFPQDVIGPLVYVCEAVCRENGIELEAEGFSQDTEVPGVVVSSKYLIEAVTNVLDNAIKFVPCKKRGRGRPSKNSLPRIKVTLVANEPPLEAGATLYVEDNGQGIDQEDMERVFERGYRGQLRDMAPGGGLGLSMSKMFIEKMGGTLEILQEGPNQMGGATVRIILFRDPAL